MFKYLCTLESGRTFVLGSDIKDDIKRAEDVGYDAYEEACLMDDYLVDVTRID